MTTALDLLEIHSITCETLGINPKIKRRKKQADGWPTVKAAPGYERIYAEYVKSKPRRPRTRISTKVLSYPKVKLHPYNPLRRWPDDLVKVPPTHRDDVAFRRKHPTLDRWLARCEVAGHINRRYASWLGDGQVITFPAYPGSLDDGVTVDWTVPEIMANLTMIANA